MIGDLRLREFIHPDGGMRVWSVQQLCLATGKYASEGDTWWKTLDPQGEPFTSKEDAWNHMNAIFEGTT